MDWLLPAVLASLTMAVVLVLVFGYLYLRSRRIYMLLWTGAWIAQAARYGFMLVMVRWPNPWLLSGAAVTTLAGGLLLLVGADRLLDRRTSRLWWGAACLSIAWIFGCALSAGALGRQLILWISAPGFTIVGVAYLLTGLALLKHFRGLGAGRHIAGWSLILLGLHKFNYPFLRPVEWFAPIGYWISSALALATAIGMMLVYFEQSQRELEASEDRFRRLFQAGADAIFVVSPEGRVIEANQQACHSLGYDSPAQLRGLPAERVQVDLDHEDIVQANQAAIGGEVFSLSGRHRRADGSTFPVEVRVSAVQWDRQTAVMAIARDVSQRVAAEAQRNRQAAINQALAATAQRLISPDASVPSLCRVILESARALTGAEHGFVGEVDRSTHTLVCHTLTDMLANQADLPKDTGVTFPRREDGTYPSLWGQALNDRKGFYTNEPANHPASRGTPEGHVPIRNFLAVPALIGDTPVGMIALANAPDGFFCGSLDVAERLSELLALAVQRHRDREDHEQLEAQLRQAQKMEAVGQLAGGIAHDFNNFLQVIKGSAELLARHSKDDTTREIADEVIRTADRAAAVTRQLLTFSRQRPPQRHPIHLADVIRNTRDLVRRGLGERIDLAVTCDSDTPAIEGDAGQLEQVVLNLCVNARDAMPDGGRIELHTFRWEPDPAADLIGGPATQALYAGLTVRDTGTGMAPDVREHAFEPFFSTKEVGKGTGLGLAMVYGIVQAHQGRFRVESEPGEGTAVTVLLPATTRPVPQESRSPAKASPAVEGEGTVLLAEDDPSVRRLTQRILESAGFRVVPARDGNEAIDLFRRHRDELRLAILDAVMPHATGPQVLQVIRDDGSTLPVIFCTGYSEQDITISAGNGERVTVLDKPFTQDDLLEAIEQMTPKTV